MNKALFLDRDGVINIDKGYVYKFEDIEWCDGIFDLVEFANKNGFIVVVLTNQSGVAKGMYKVADVLELHRRMNDVFLSKNLRIHDWIFCEEDDGPRRKPSPGMMIEASQKYQINLNESIMIGDKVTDVLNIEGPKTYLVKGQYSLDSLVVSERVQIFKNLRDILEKIKVEFN